VDSLKVYGVSFEESTGLYVDNFAMRGNSGIGLYQIDPRTIQEFNQMRHYRLILLQYGLNVVSETDDRGYGWYIDKMVKVIQRLRENLPESNFLLVSVSDRCYNQGGKFVTIPNILLMRDAQREIARKSGIAFWDLLAAMDGDDSMIKLVNATPPMASKDYTHLNFSGGRRLSKKLADALLYEKIKYDSLHNTKH
jgi:lysophospholipase L1-like esterase